MTLVFEYKNEIDSTQHKKSGARCEVQTQCCPNEINLGVCRQRRTSSLNNFSL